ncbi:MAG: DUF1189 domain-containing protein [Chitinivibrionales bacterium]|nr:DUF1189 domain-containing protein [Chitinivibrionales bacterium]
MNFFQSFHRSIVDPDYYKEIVSFSFFRPFKYLVSLLLISSLISGVFHTWHAFSLTDGLPVYLAEIFKKIRYENGELHPERETPYMPNKSYIAQALDIHFNVEGTYSLLPDSLLIVDTAATPSKYENSSTWVVLGKRQVFLTFGGVYLKTLSYSTFMLESLKGKNIERKIKNYLQGQTLSFFLFYFTRNIIRMAGALLFGILFLSFATYIFSMRRVVSLRDIFKMSCFAVSPISAGVVISAAAGVRWQWIPYIFLFISSMVLLRGVRANIGKIENNTTE